MWPGAPQASCSPRFDCEGGGERGVRLPMHTVAELDTRQLIGQGTTESTFTDFEGCISEVGFTSHTHSHQRQIRKWSQS